MKRRDFFRETFTESVKVAQKSLLSLQETVNEVAGSVQGIMDDPIPGDGDFFDSYEMSYSLTLAYPRELFEQMAREQGLSYEGVETIKIADELHKRGVI